MVLWFGVAPPYHTVNLWFYFQKYCFSVFSLPLSGAN
jgi:hypothetical protein